MQIKISKSDLLQSLGFAITSATEEYERIRSGVSDALQRALLKEEVVSPEVQADLSRALTHAKQHLDRLTTLNRMAEFGREDDLFLTEESFLLLEHNLPAR